MGHPVEVIKVLFSPNQMEHIVQGQNSDNSHSLYIYYLALRYEFPDVSIIIIEFLTCSKSVTSFINGKSKEFSQL